MPTMQGDLTWSVLDQDIATQSFSSSHGARTLPTCSACIFVRLPGTVLARQRGRRRRKFRDARNKESQWISKWISKWIFNLSECLNLFMNLCSFLCNWAGRRSSNWQLGNFAKGELALLPTASQVWRRQLCTLTVQSDWGMSHRGYCIIIHVSYLAKAFRKLKERTTSFMALRMSCQECYAANVMSLLFAALATGPSSSLAHCKDCPREWQKGNKTLEGMGKDGKGLLHSILNVHRGRLRE